MMPTYRTSPADVSRPCPHREPPYMDYVTSQCDADARLVAGERHRYCPVCRRWLWASYFDEATA